MKVVQRNSTDSIWNDLNNYYNYYGIGYTWCCFPAEQYSHKMYYLDSWSELDPIEKRILEHSIKLAAHVGYHPDNYEVSIVCVSHMTCPFVNTSQLLCAYMLDSKAWILSDRFEDFFSEYKGQCVLVYMWKK